MGQHFTLGAGPAQIVGQHVLPRLYGCHRLCEQQSLTDPTLAKCYCKPSYIENAFQLPYLI